MANVEVVNRTLALTPRGNIGDVLTIIDAATVEFAPPAGGGVVGPGTPGAVAVFTGVAAVGNNLPGTDTTLNVPLGQVGVFALNAVSLMQFTGAGLRPTVNHGVASGDAAHYWANIYGLNLLSDLDLGLDAPAGHTIIQRVNAVPVLTIAAAVVTSAQPIAIGAAGAHSGALRLQNQDTISARNAANAADVVLMQLTAADRLKIFNTWTWPAADGGALTFLQTDGAGNLSFATPGAGAVVVNAIAPLVGPSTGQFNLSTTNVTGLAGRSIRIRVTFKRNAGGDYFGVFLGPNINNGFALIYGAGTIYFVKIVASVQTTISTLTGADNNTSTHEIEVAFLLNATCQMTGTISATNGQVDSVGIVDASVDLSSGTLYFGYYIDNVGPDYHGAYYTQVN